jgi:hypothetical protein
MLTCSDWSHLQAVWQTLSACLEKYLTTSPGNLSSKYTMAFFVQCCDDQNRARRYTKNLLELGAHCSNSHDVDRKTGEQGV